MVREGAKDAMRNKMKVEDEAQELRLKRMLEHNKMEIPALREKMTDYAGVHDEMIRERPLTDQSLLYKFDKDDPHSIISGGAELLPTKGENNSDAVVVGLEVPTKNIYEQTQDYCNYSCTAPTAAITLAPVSNGGPDCSSEEWKSESG